MQIEANKFNQEEILTKVREHWVLNERIRDFSSRLQLADQNELTQE